jgi:hypothetical protein
MVTELRAAVQEASRRGAVLPSICWGHLALAPAWGAFGDFRLAEWRPRGLKVVVTDGHDLWYTGALGRQRRAFEEAGLLTHPHGNVVQVYGICTDAPDGKLRLVMQHCEAGSLFDYLVRKRVEVRVDG